MRYSDPTGHFTEDEVEDYLKEQYGENYQAYLDAWRSDKVFWEVLMEAQYGDTLGAPTTQLGTGLFIQNGDSFGFVNFSGADNLYEYQGYGPYALNGETNFQNNIGVHPNDQNWVTVTSIIDQPLYNYTENGPVYSGWHRQVSYRRTGWHLNPSAGDAIPVLVSVPLIQLTSKIPEIGPAVAVTFGVGTAVTFLNNFISLDYTLTVNFVDMHTYLDSNGPCWTVPGGNCWKPRPDSGDTKEYIK